MIRIDEVLDRFFAERVSRAAPASPAYESLWRRLSAASSGGKRSRPALLLDAHRAFGDPHPEDALLAAAAFELLHTALLLHDDVIDGDLTRRGRTNLPGAFAEDAAAEGLDGGKGAAWGDASGILGGDLLLSGAHLLLARIEAPARARLHEIVDEALFLTAAGEHADVAFGLGVVPAHVDDLLRMMANKTASYSFSAPLRAGAELAGAGSAAEELDRIGAALGVLYQLRDDVLGVFGAEEQTGKSTTGDLREGKRTLLVAFAEGHPEWDAVRHLFGRADLGRADADRLRGALVASGARDAVEDLIDRRRSELRAAVAESGLPAALRDTLSRVVQHSAERAS